MTSAERADRSRWVLALVLALSGCGSDDDGSGGQDDGGDTETTDAGSGPGTSGGTTDSTTASTSAGTTTGSGTDTDNPMSACTNDDQCDDGNPCNGVETCSADDVCLAGDPPEGSVPCGDGMMCFDGECFAAVCGNGTIEPGEQCDDGNQDTFDGCDPDCYYEVFYRTYELTMMASPAGSFCDRPDSALGDALSSFALESDNAARKTDIDTGVYNSVFQLVGFDDPSGMTDETIEFRSGTAVTDPDRGTFPTDGTNPIDWWFLMDEISIARDGGIAERLSDVQVTEGSFLGGGGVNMAALPQFLDGASRGHFDYSTPPDTPPGPPDELADGLVVPREVIGDGDDEGVCGNLTVAFMAATPADETLADCLECPGASHAYTICAGDVVDDTCNSSLDPLVGGCIIGPNCLAGFQVITPTQPDVDQGGPGPLENDTNNLNKIPASMTDGNLNGYSVYFTFRARRAQVTGTL